MDCALSGVEPLFPVVSRNGHVFEKSLIEKHLSQNPTCPITGEPMSIEELIPLKPTKISKPRTAPATSIPSLLQIFQNEWDSTVLECFNLKKQLDATRQELAHALYQHDAACRVIARLIKERDESRAQLEKIKLSNQSHQKDSEMEVEQQGFTEEFKEKITKVSLELSEARKTRDTTALSIDSIQEFKELSSNPVHSSSSPGIFCVDIFHKNNNLILTGGGDNNAVLFDRNAKKKLATLSAHSKAVTAVNFFITEDVLFTGSKDSTVNVWKSPENAHSYTPEFHITTHKAGISSIDLHPLHYLLTSSLDGHWGFHDIQTGATIANVRHPLDSPIVSANLHPDSLLYTTGLHNGKISIWDTRNQNTIQTLDAHKGGVTSLKCSENGYYLVSSGETEVSLWDLRKCAVLRKMEFDHKHTSPITSVDIVHSGKYTAISGPDVKILLTNSLEEIHTLNNHTDNVTSVKWSRDGSFLASTSLDRSLKLYGL